MSTTSSSFEGRTVLITGANRGLGRALVEEALERGAGRVYAGSRAGFTHGDGRVVPLILDVTDPGQIAQAAQQVGAVDVLVNNAGISLPDDLGDRAAFTDHLAVNLYGTLDVTQAFLPHLAESEGAIVNVISLAALAAVPVLPAYSVSKAAAFSLTQALRALVACDNITVHAVLPGPIDTDMVRDLPVPKTAPDVVARAILDGVEQGEEEIFPDPLAAPVGQGWAGGAVKAFERQNAAMAQTAPTVA